MGRILILMILIAAGLTAAIMQFGLPQAARNILPAQVVDIADSIAAKGPITRYFRDENSDAPAFRPNDGARKAGISANANLKVSQAGLKLIRESTPLRLEAYTIEGREYIGYGHRLQPGEPRTITEADAERLFAKDIEIIEDSVRSALSRPATRDQYSAMVSLAFHLGVRRFTTRSDVLKDFNAGEIERAANAFRDHTSVNGEIYPHLVERREKERRLFLSAL